jgi:putative transposase
LSAANDIDAMRQRARRAYVQRPEQSFIEQFVPWTWAMDFVHDQLATGGKLRALTILDTFSRFSPAIEPRFSFRGADVVETLNRSIRVDQGSEFVSRDLDLWAYQRDVTLDFSRPGKPTVNAFIESFNGKFRAECLNPHWFMSLDDVRRKCESLA